MYIHSAEEYATYLEYVDGDVPFLNADEMRALIKAWNPDVTLESITDALGTNFTIEDVMARHAS